jgi:predicted RND superfamily exporter protein
MAVAMLSVTWTMGLMIGTGFTVHIMASMIPIFLMPIAILDSIHVLSEFFDRYPRYRDKRETLRAVYKELFVPITYTTLTTAAAFAFLALAPIPPVRVFGIFVAFGVLSAWVLTMLFIPAFIMLLNEKGLARATSAGDRTNAMLTSGLKRLGGFAVGGGRFILPAFVLLAVVAVPGITRINVNDNPVNWFKPGSDIRQSTEVLNDHLPGVYNASLLVEAEDPAILSDPAVAAAVAGFQDHIADNEFVGQTTSYVDVVTTENYLANDRDEAFRTIPTDRTAIETSLASAAASPELAAVGSLITSDYRRANVQVLMNNGDNTAMQSVIDDAESYFAGQALPGGVTVEWAGETYLNLVWQNKMVSGMLKAFLSTFLVVFVLMVLLFRSLRWAVLAMIPMSVTILLVYGTMGLVGKDYDMPLAVLSTLVLGIGVDFAIHFVQRYRELAGKLGESRKALEAFFDEPARALTRNALIIAIGFVPMFFATLTPYIYVGVHLASVMLLSWLATLLLLPALITVLPFGARTERSAPPNLEPSEQGVLS